MREINGLLAQAGSKAVDMQRIHVSDCRGGPTHSYTKRKEPALPTLLPAVPRPVALSQLAGGQVVVLEH